MPWSVMVIPTCLHLLNNAESYGLGYAAAAGTVGVAGCVLDFEALVRVGHFLFDCRFRIEVGGAQGIAPPHNDCDTRRGELPRISK